MNWELGWGVNRTEFSANVALYLPAGFCLARVLARPHRAQGLIVLALGVPTTVEVLQNALALGRVSDVNDVAANGLGACIGLACALVPATAAPRRRLARVPSAVPITGSAQPDQKEADPAFIEGNKP